MNYLALFQEYNIPADLSRMRSHWINVPCPYCGGTSFHLGFHITDDFCTCFKCGGHNLRMTLAKVLNVPSDTLTQILEPYQTRSRILARLNDEKPLNKEKIELPGYPLSKAEKDYLFARHFNPNELIAQYGIQGGGWVGDWKNRIIIPVFLGSKLITWIGRTILSDREPRYKNLENKESVINPKNIFMNLDNCPNDYVALLEGPFDVLRFGNNGICGFGITLTRTQIMFLSDRFKKIYIIFDNQRIAQKKAKEYGTLLSGHGLEIFTVDISDYGVKDVGELSPYKTKMLKKELFGEIK